MAGVKWPARTFVDYRRYYRYAFGHADHFRQFLRLNRNGLIESAGARSELVPLRVHISTSVHELRSSDRPDIGRTGVFELLFSLGWRIAAHLVFIRYLASWPHLRFIDAWISRGRYRGIADGRWALQLYDHNPG